MPFKKTLTIISFFFVYLALLWGCQGNRPLGPEKVVSLNVSIPATSEVKSSLIGTAANEILYRVDGAGVSNIHGTVGPFTTAAPSGSYGFALDIPSGGLRVLSVQLNNAATHQPLALGAVGIDLSPNAPVTDVIVVEMGSVTRNCYYTKNINYLGTSYSFATDGMPDAVSNDIKIFSVGAGYQILDAQGLTAFAYNTISYLGNGNFVDYDYVPPAASFSSTSTSVKSGPVSTLEIGDIYCVKLGTMTGYAWMQVTDLGTPALLAPSFRFRVNKILPYFAFDQTLADITGTCSTSH